MLPQTLSFFARNTTANYVVGMANAQRDSLNTWQQANHQPGCLSRYVVDVGNQAQVCDHCASDSRWRLCVTGDCVLLCVGCNLHAGRQTPRSPLGGGGPWEEGCGQSPKTSSPASQEGRNRKYSRSDSEG
jgi:hypothetical protein